MIYCSVLNKSYASQEDMFRALKANEVKIIALKKSQEFRSAEKGQLSISGAFLKSDFVVKAGLIAKKGYVYPVINTTRYMDMHSDVHFDGLWKKTLQEQVGKIFYLSAHLKNIDNVIAWPEDVHAFTTMLDWSFVGKDYQGQTEALVFEIEESKIRKDSALEAIRERRKVQGSVGMFYVKIAMGMNSNDKDYAINKAYYDSKIDLIVNKERAEEQGYFFGVEEAKINKEGSMVLQGSNDATEIIYPEEPPEGTQHKAEPTNVTQSIDYSYLVKNLKKAIK